MQVEQCVLVKLNSPPPRFYLGIRMGKKTAIGRRRRGFEPRTNLLKECGQHCLVCIGIFCRAAANMREVEYYLVKNETLRAGGVCCYRIKRGKRSCRQCLERHVWSWANQWEQRRTRAIRGRLGQYTLTGSAWARSWASTPCATVTPIARIPRRMLLADSYFWRTCDSDTASCRDWPVFIVHQCLATAQTKIKLQPIASLHTGCGAGTAWWPR
jgi:hypothetical protein